MLPKSNSNMVPIKLGKETIFISPWKTKQQKDYLLYKASLSDIEDIDYNEIQENIFNILLKDNVRDYDNLNLLSDEKIYILMKIRELSISDSITLTFKCDNKDCNFLNETDIKLDDIIHFKQSTFKNIKINDIIFGIKKPDEKDYNKRINNKMPIIEKNFIKLVLSIDKIIQDGKTYDEFTYEEMYEYLNDLDSNIFNELFEKFYEMNPNITFSIKTKCINCKKEYTEEIIEDISNFLWE